MKEEKRWPEHLFSSFLSVKVSFFERLFNDVSDKFVNQFYAEKKSHRFRAFLNEFKSCFFTYAADQKIVDVSLRSLSCLWKYVITAPNIHCNEECYQENLSSVNYGNLKNLKIKNETLWEIWNT